MSHLYDKTGYSVVSDVNNGVFTSAQSVDDRGKIYMAEVTDILDQFSQNGWGGIRFRFFDEINRVSSSLNVAYPIDFRDMALPLISEIVPILAINDKFYWLNPVSVFNFSNNNKYDGYSTITVPSNINNINSYLDVINTQEPKSPIVNRRNSVEDATKNNKIKLLPIKNGERILTGRSANFIKFGESHNLKITQRNKVNSESQTESIKSDNGIWITTDEIINLKFNPKISKFNNPPEKFNNQQILVFSDRIVLYSKLNELIGISENSILFTSKNIFGIDAEKDINIYSRANLNLYGERLRLGSPNSSSASVKGDVLVSILKDLLKLLMSDKHIVVPNSPQTSGTLNVSSYSSLMSKLDTLLSKKIYIE